MDQYLKTLWYGTFLYTDTGIVTAKLFPKTAEAIADRLILIREKKILKEERDVAQGTGPVQPFVEEDRLRKIGRLRESVPLPRVTPEEHGFTQDLLHQASLQVARVGMERELRTKERQITQAVHAIDDLLHISNLLMERLREWYGSFVPDALEMDGKKLAALVGNQGDSDLEHLGILHPGAIKSVADTLQRTYQARDVIEGYIREWMPLVASNVTQLVGATLGARLIALAGGLEHLAMMPAGTVQLLGAETALFRHLTEGAAPPKHGILFQHELINKSPYWQRGKIARSFAAKISIAAKADAFTRRDIAGMLQKDLTDRVATIRRRYPTANS